MKRKKILIIINLSFVFIIMVLITILSVERKISDNKIELEYSLEGNKFKYLLEVVHEGKIKKSNKWCFR